MGLFKKLASKAGGLIQKVAPQLVGTALSFIPGGGAVSKVATGLLTKLASSKMSIKASPPPPPQVMYQAQQAALDAPPSTTTTELQAEVFGKPAGMRTRAFSPAKAKAQRTSFTIDTGTKKDWIQRIFNLNQPAQWYHYVLAIGLPGGIIAALLIALFRRKRRR